MTRSAELRWLAAITVIAAAARFIGLDTMPPGMTLDEARLGLLAQAVLRGEDPRPWQHSMEAPSWIPTAALFAVLPDTLGVLRLVPAAWGTLTIPALWWAVRPAGGPVLALAAATALAVMRWHVGLTRIAVCPYQMVLAAIIAAGCLVRAFRDPAIGRWWWWSGITVGFSLHLYAGARVLPAVIGMGIAGWWLDATAIPVRDRRRAILRWVGGLATGFVAGGWYLIDHPGWFLERAGQVSGEVAGSGGFWRNALRGVLALNAGGTDLMHTFPAPGGSPLLAPVAAILWVPGLAVVLRGCDRPVRWMLVAWTSAGFAGGVFSGPHGMRQFLLAPVAALAAAAAAGWLVNRFAGRHALAAGLALAGLHAGAELWRYGLGRSGGIDPGVVGWVYRDMEVALAARIREEATNRPVYWAPMARRPAGTPWEWYAAPTIFLSSTAVRRDAQVSGDLLAADSGVCVIPVISQHHLALLREIYPGGELWGGRSLDPRRAAAYAAGTDSLRRAKIPLEDSTGILFEIWKSEREMDASRWDTAVARCAALAVRWPAVGGIRTVEAAAWLGAGRLAEGEAAARAAIRAGAAGGLAGLYLGSALLDQRRFTEAAAALRAAIRAEPELEDAWLARVVALFNGGRREEAFGELAEAVRRFPGSGRVAALGAQLRR